MDDFHNLCEHLLPLITIAETEEVIFKGFSKNTGVYGIWLIKTPLNDNEITLLKKTTNNINNSTTGKKNIDDLI
jgi:hypothetical protein